MYVQMIGGTFQQWVPGSSVLPMREVSAVPVEIPFTGLIMMDPSGNRFIGQTQDRFGVARISGTWDQLDNVFFEKTYVTGQSVGVVFQYTLSPSGGSGAFEGHYSQASANASSLPVKCFIAEF